MIPIDDDNDNDIEEGGTMMIMKEHAESKVHDDEGWAK